MVAADRAYQAHAVFVEVEGLTFGIYRDGCDEAGLPHCSAHGLRKAANRQTLAEDAMNPAIQ